VVFKPATLGDCVWLNKTLHPTAYSFGFPLRLFLTSLQAFASGSG
jgi:hypothetical protein